MFNNLTNACRGQIFSALVLLLFLGFKFG